MNKKKILADFKIKLTDLKINDQLKYESLNHFANYLNKAIDNLGLQDVDKVNLLNSGQSNYSSTPTTSEAAKRVELINIYSEALTEINPNLGKNILVQFKESSTVFKLVNISVIIAIAGLFWTIGKDTAKPSTSQKERTSVNIDSLNSIINEKDLQINQLKHHIDSLETNATKVDVSYLTPGSIFNGKIFITTAKVDSNKSKITFKGIDGTSKKQTGPFEKTEIVVSEGDRIYFKFANQVYGANIIDLVLGIEMEVVKI